MANPKLYNYYVVGSRTFPADMLRYDSCYPNDTDSACNITMGLHDEELYREYRMVALQGLREPTKGRWESFSWFVFKTPSEAREFVKRCNANQEK